jgi:hypothetical protein
MKMTNIVLTFDPPSNQVVKYLPLPKDHFFCWMGANQSRTQKVRRKMRKQESEELVGALVKLP